MGDEDRDRLARLEGVVGLNSKRLNQGIKDQAEMAASIVALQKAVEGINATLQNMASDEIADLRRKAELPRRILYAVLLPVLVAAVTAAVGAALAGVFA